MSDNSTTPPSGITYQWYTKNSSGNLREISNGTNSSVTFKASQELNGKQLLVKATYNGKTVESSPKIINVNKRVIQTLTITGTDGVLTDGDNITLTSSFTPNFGNDQTFHLVKFYINDI